MSFRDKLIYCETSRRTFVLSVNQQRQIVERGDSPGEAAVQCDICRAFVKLAAVPTDEGEGSGGISALVREGCTFMGLDHSAGAQARGGYASRPVPVSPPSTSSSNARCTG